jgi:hypothetical protein
VVLQIIGIAFHLSSFLVLILVMGIVAENLILLQRG